MNKLWSNFLYLEYIGEVSQVEDVVELDGGGKEGRCDLLVEGQRCVHQLLCVLLNLAGETSTHDMALEDAQVDCTQ